MAGRQSCRQYLNSEDVDALARQNTQLMAELWIVKDRLAILEKLLAEKGILATDEVDDSPPDEALSAELARERDRYVQRIAGIPPEERSIDTLKALGEK